MAGLLAVTAVALAIVLGGLYLFSVARPTETVRQFVAQEALHLEVVDRRKGQAALVRELELRRSAPSAQKPFDALVDRDGRLIAGNLPSWPKAAGVRWLSIEADLYRDGDEDDHEALSREIALPGGRRLIVGRDVELLSDREELIIQTALWGFIAVLVIGPIGGLIVSQSITRRLDDIRRTALAVMNGDLGGRVRVKGSGDDFDRLATTLNAMLDRIADLVDSIARVSDHIAHELRTPLARLRASLETLRDEGNEFEGPGLVTQSLEEAVRLQMTFDALLRITRLDTGRHSIASEPVRLDGLVRDAVEYYAPASDAREQKVSMRLDETALRGDADLLFQAVTNLIDNAVKFTPRAGSIKVSLENAGTGPVLTIRDSGPGVAGSDRERLTERFYRAPGSASTTGIGLGLSLVEAIVAAHNGRVSFSGSPGAFDAILDFRSAAASNSAR